MVAVWGMRAIGRYVEVSEDAEIEHGATYEMRYTTPIDIPDNLEMPIIQALRSLHDYISGTQTTYIYVGGTTIIIQWKAVSTPISLSVVAYGIIAILAGLAVTAALTRVYQIVSFLGSDTINLILQTILFVAILNLITSMLPRFGRR